MDKLVEDLVSRMTLKEKISQMSQHAPAIERLDVQAYDPVYKNPLNTGQEIDRERMEKLKKYSPAGYHKYLKAIATVKHFAAKNSEFNRPFGYS